MRTVLFVLCQIIFMVSLSMASTVTTKYGSYHGKVTSRMFEHIVVTLVSSDQRVFQYAATDVDMISATETVLVSVNTFLRKEASNSAEPAIALTRGQEVLILEEPENSNWIHVQVWGKHEGWMIKELLTNKVVFTPEEKAQSVLRTRNPIETDAVRKQNDNQVADH